MAPEGEDQAPPSNPSISKPTPTADEVCHKALDYYHGTRTTAPSTPFHLNSSKMMPTCDHPYKTK